MPTPDNLTAQQFVRAVYAGRRDLEGVVVTGNVFISDWAFNPPLSLKGVTFMNSLNMTKVSGVDVSGVRARGSINLVKVQS